MFVVQIITCFKCDKKLGVVGGLEVLKEIELIPTNKQDKPLEKLRITDVVVYANPFKEYEQQEESGTVSPSQNVE